MPKLIIKKKPKQAQITMSWKPDPACLAFTNSYDLNNSF